LLLLFLFCFLFIYLFYSFIFQKTPSGHKVKCSRTECDQKFALSAATPDPNTGQLVWRRFPSAPDLEQHLNKLLQPPEQGKKHFGFVLVGCGGEWMNYDGEEVETVSDDENVVFESVQLLLLPPSVPSTSSHSATPFVPLAASSRKRQKSKLSKRNQHAKHAKSSPYSGINYNLIFIDSVSRQHFFRSLPKTVKFLESVSLNVKTNLDKDFESSPQSRLKNNREVVSSKKESPSVNVFDFELVQSVRSRTFETLQVLFSGEIDPSVKPFGVLELPPESLRVEALWSMFKEQGYSTLWLEDLCYLWEWGLSKDLLVHNKTFTSQETWMKLQNTLRKKSIDSLEVTYAMCKILSENGVNDHFHGPDAVCYNGIHQHEYLLDYLWLYQDAMSDIGIPYFTFTETNVGHEDTGRRIQSYDKSFVRYLQHALTQKNTLTVIFSDHGNSYGPFLGQTEEARMELFHPHLFMLVPEKAATTLGERAMEALALNQRRLISHLDLHYMLMGLATNFKNKVPEKHRYVHVHFIEVIHDYFLNSQVVDYSFSFAGTMTPLKTKALRALSLQSQISLYY
jgi:hypothetical protein